MRRLVRRLLNFIRWLPFVWRDAQYDYDFLLVLLREKLRRMEVFFRSDHTHILHALERAEEIHTALAALDRILRRDYYEMAFLEHAAKWGAIEVDMPDDSDEINMYYPWARTDEEQAQARDEAKECFVTMRALEDADWGTIWDTMKLARGWWD